MINKISTFIEPALHSLLCSSSGFIKLTNCVIKFETLKDCVAQRGSRHEWWRPESDQHILSLSYQGIGGVKRCR